MTAVSAEKSSTDNTIGISELDPCALQGLNSWLGMKKISSKKERPPIMKSAP